MVVKGENEKEERTEGWEGERLVLLVRVRVIRKMK